MRNGFKARSRNEPRSRDPRGPRGGGMSIVIVGSQASASRRTFLLGSIDAERSSGPAHIRILHLG